MRSRSVADETARAEPENGLTNADWGRIHKKAWCDDGFRRLLETDPTEAIRRYVREHNDEQEKKGGRTIRLDGLKMVKLRPKPCDVPDEFLEDVNPFPPSCC
jgi:hypothetical protein